MPLVPGRHTRSRSRATARVLSGVGFLEYARRVRRGERGVEWMGGPLWNPAWGTGMPAVPLSKKNYLCKPQGSPLPYGESVTEAVYGRGAGSPPACPRPGSGTGRDKSGPYARLSWALRQHYQDW